MTKRARLIWRGLVRYANDEQVDLDDLHKTISTCMPWAAQLSVLGFADFVLNNPKVFSKQATEYRPAIRDVLAALCGEPRRLPAEASAFLMDHGGHVRISFDEAPFDPDDEEHFEESNRVWQLSGEPKKRPLGIYTRSKNYQDIADPICDFILNELERIAEDDGQLPICACEGPNCNKLIMPERTGKRTVLFRRLQISLLPTEKLAQCVERLSMALQVLHPRASGQTEGRMERRLASPEAGKEQSKFREDPIGAQACSQDSEIDR